MKPSVSEILGGAAMTMATGVLPHLEAVPYARGHAGTILMLMAFAAQEADRAAATLAQENASLRALFSRAAGLPLPDDLAQRLGALAVGADASLRVSALQAGNATLKAALVALHSAVETMAGDAAATIEAEILALLVRGAEGRALALPPL